MKHYITLISSFLLSLCICTAQEKIGGVIEIDRTVHNFGDILIENGPVSCSFTLTNISEKPIVIYNVVTTCGCTDVKWTKEPIRPGGKGKVSVTYSNDEGAYPFDKTITMYVSDIKKPVLLKVRGVSLDRKKPLEELYPVAFGPFAVKGLTSGCGNLEQGERKSEAVMVANLSDRPIKVDFKDVSDFLNVSVYPNPIPARSTAEMSFTVTSSRELWGKNTYQAVPVINGQTYSTSEGNRQLYFSAFTKENFGTMSEAEKNKGPMPKFKVSTFSAGKIRRGETIHAEFSFTNEGKDIFKVYKVDADAEVWSHSDIPSAKPGEKVTFKVHVDTSDMPNGEVLTIVTLTTNSPVRPIVNLFVAGWIE